jgi:hypothetical protein
VLALQRRVVQKSLQLLVLVVHLGELLAVLGEGLVGVLEVAHQPR